MAAQRVPKRKKLDAKLEKDVAVTNEKIKFKPKTVTTPAKAKERARLKSNEPLAKVHKALQVAQAEVKRERQARAKAEKALAKTQEALAVTRLKVEHQAPIRRVSFVVRLTVYEHGQIGRTEIEHVESSRKQNFLSLDGERLVAFMKAYITPISIPEDAIYQTSPPEKLITKTVGLPAPKSSLIISDVQVFRLGTPDLLALILRSEEPFGLKAHFQLQGPEAQLFSNQEISFELKVYANEITSSKSKLHTTYSGNVIENMLAYTIPIEVPALSLGLYRLFTVITLHAPIKLAGFYGKTIIHVE